MSTKSCSVIWIDLSVADLGNVFKDSGKKLVRFQTHLFLVTPFDILYLQIKDNSILQKYHNA